VLKGRHNRAALFKHEPDAYRPLSMKTMSNDTANGPDSRAQGLVASYARAGYALIDPPVLQPAEPFLDLSGEDIRRRMFLTSDPDGRELCLRPDLTIPVSRDYLASPSAGKPAGFCYLGAVFRHRENGTAEFVQAGIESFGRQDRAAADAEMVTLGLEATTQYGIGAPEIRMGDVGLFAAFVAALDLAPAWKRRLIKDFNRKSSLTHDLDQLTLATANGKPEYQGVLAALANSDPKGAHQLVTDLLSIAGIAAVGGRSVAEIADRFLEQAAMNAPARLPRETRSLIERFLSVHGDPDEAAAELRTLASDAKIPLDDALALLETRTGFLAARGIDVRAIKFSTSFGRGFDYYTGVVFELHNANTNPPRVNGALVAGGRYDGLLTRLGAAAPIPAVGFAASIDELAACGGAS
jgi:ATP phosphoribosyltransferase regulatory subunit